MPPQPPAADSPPLFRRILVPLDGSILATAALPYAIRLARLCDADVTLLMVVPPIEAVIEGPAETISIDSQWETRSAQALRYLSVLCEKPECRGARTHTAVSMGRAAETILTYADSQKSDVIVMTTHGRSGLDRWVWGSVADKVLHAARVPVLLVRSGASDQSK